ncbi:VOC family protein [uncultured Ruegeria sp.]|uniref:VOC family protein n=1 Tax=uncultured Ruegeria sp. TaxID=259304 RepID=UPI00345B7C45
MGAGNKPLIALEKDAAARSYPNEAGLFHTAFLLPNRSDLGSWLLYVEELGIRLDGASDHLVSEALYLQDPEGNGVEVYWDRPRSDWQRSGDHIQMDTRRLDLENLVHTASSAWTHVPTDTVIGHVHLQVGDVSKADAFMTEHLGMTKTFGVPSAGWYGSGDYHHHLAANVWKSPGVATRPANATGLSEIELLSDTNALQTGFVNDPWGNRFSVKKAQMRAT